MKLKFPVNIDNETILPMKLYQFCGLFSDGDVKCFNHSVRDYLVFKTVYGKIIKFKNVNGCVMCGYTNHSTRECKFKLKCFTYDVSYGLSCKKTKFNNFDKKAEPYNVSTGMIWTGSVLGYSLLSVTHNQHSALDWKSNSMNE